MSDTSLIRILEVVAWPSVGLMLGIVAVCVFRVNLGGLIDRIRRVGIVEAEGPTAVAAQESEKKEAPQDEKSLKQFIAIAQSSPVAQAMANDIRKALADGNITNAADMADALIWLAAAVAAAREYEEIHSFIFGSQISLLRSLNSLRHVGRTKPDVGEFFQKVKEANQATFDGWDTGKYMAFLLNRGLVEVRNDHVFIAPKGVEYLKWMTDAGRSDNKPM